MQGTSRVDITEDPSSDEDNGKEALWVYKKTGSPIWVEEVEKGGQNWLDDDPMPTSAVRSYSMVSYGARRGPQPIVFPIETQQTQSNAIPGSDFKISLPVDIHQIHQPEVITNRPLKGPQFLLAAQQAALKKQSEEDEPKVVELKSDYNDFLSGILGEDEPAEMTHVDTVDAVLPQKSNETEIQPGANEITEGSQQLSQKATVSLGVVVGSLLSPAWLEDRLDSGDSELGTVGSADEEFQSIEDTSPHAVSESLKGMNSDVQSEIEEEFRDSKLDSMNPSQHSDVDLDFLNTSANSAKQNSHTSATILPTVSQELDAQIAQMKIVRDYQNRKDMTVNDLSSADLRKTRTESQHQERFFSPVKRAEKRTRDRASISDASEFEDLRKASKALKLPSKSPVQIDSIANTQAETAVESEFMMPMNEAIINSAETNLQTTTSSEPINAKEIELEASELEFPTSRGPAALADPLLNTETHKVPEDTQKNPDPAEVRSKISFL